MVVIAVVVVVCESSHSICNIIFIVPRSLRFGIEYQGVVLILASATGGRSGSIHFPLGTLASKALI